MSEQRIMPEVLPGDLITQVGLYEARCGDIVRITGWRDGWWVSIWNGVRTYYSSDGRQRYDEGQEPNQWQLLHWVGPLPATEPKTETTTEQLAEIEGQAADTPATEYTPPEHAAATQAVVDAGKQNDALRLQVQNRQQEYERQKSRIEFLETLNAGNGAAIDDYKAKVEKLQGLVDIARQRLEAAATECDQLRAAINRADKQLDQKDAQIRNLRIELDAAQQVPQPVGDEERERIWDEATEAAGRQVIGWLRPLTLALHRQPDERFSRLMALTLSVLPDILPELLGYAVEDESLDTDEDRE